MIWGLSARLAGRCRTGRGRRETRRRDGGSEGLARMTAGRLESAAGSCEELKKYHQPLKRTSKRPNSETRRAHRITHPARTSLTPSIPPSWPGNMLSPFPANTGAIGSLIVALNETNSDEDDGSLATEARRSEAAAVAAAMMRAV